MTGSRGRQKVGVEEVIYGGGGGGRWIQPSPTQDMSPGCCLGCYTMLQNV